MSHPIQCTCGLFKGVLAQTKGANHCLCYCKDCQAFAHFLKREGEILDALGGSNIVQTLPKYVRFTEGVEQLACMRLGEKGLVRWYTRCCNSPVGNTLYNVRLSFVGLLDTCLKSGDRSVDEAFGPVTTVGHTKSAKGEPKPKEYGVTKAIWRVGGMILRARVSGDYKQNPFFDVDAGRPIVKPEVLSAQQRQELRDVVNK